MQNFRPGAQGRGPLTWSPGVDAPTGRGGTSGGPGCSEMKGTDSCRSTALLPPAATGLLGGRVGVLREPGAERLHELPAPGVSPRAGLDGTAPGGGRREGGRGPWMTSSHRPQAQHLIWLRRPPRCSSRRLPGSGPPPTHAPIGPGASCHGTRGLEGARPHRRGRPLGPRQDPKACFVETRPCTATSRPVLSHAPCRTP